MELRNYFDSGGGLCVNVIDKLNESKCGGWGAILLQSNEANSRTVEGE